MFILVKNKRLFREVTQNSGGLERIKAFGKEWETLTNSEDDIELSVVWDRECRYSKMDGNKILDGMYKLKSGGKFDLLFEVDEW